MGSDVLTDLIGKSPAVVALRGQIQALIQRQVDARRFPPILLEGETGTGKGLIAQLLHRSSPRAAGPFVDVSCAAIPETLLEAEMFGFERGAFTEARHAKPGLFQTANGGTIFLDEIGLLSEGLQGKLLKVVEDRAVRRLGSVLAHAIDVQIIAATSRDLATAVREHAFRDDLYHRLAVLTLRLPALHERGEDAVLLAQHFLARACADYGLPPKRLAPEAEEALLAYPWPGNVRELRNVIERVAIMSEGAVITAAVLGLPHVSRVAAAVTLPTPGSLDDAVRDRLLAALAETRGNLTKAAARLGIARNTLLARMTRYGLRPASGRARSAARPVSRQPTEIDSRRPEPERDAGRVRWEQRWLAFLRVELADHGADPARLAAHRAIEAATERILSFGGRLAEIGSQGTAGVFGLDSLDDPPRCAALAAVAVRNVLARSRAADPRLPRFRMAIIVDETPVAFAGGQVEIDTDAKREALDRLRNLAARAAPDCILVAADSKDFLERRFDLTAVGPGAYRLVGGERPGPVFTTFVGRTAELAVIRHAFEQARAGHGQVVGVVGDPGVGKSRLVREATRALHGARLLETQGLPHAATNPYVPLTSLLAAYFMIEHGAEPAGIREKISSSLRQLDPALGARLSSPLLALLDVPVEDEGWRAADPQRRRQSTLEAFTLLLLRESQVQPLVLVFDDLHWIDSETQAVLDRLVEMIPAARVLLVAVYRPEYRHSWSARSYYVQVPVEPLPPETADELARALTGDRTELDALRRQLVERAGGSPLFLEESVRMLVDTNMLVGDPSMYRLARSVDDIAIPDTVRSTLATRIYRLAPDEKALLEIAAVIGPEVPGGLLEATAGMAADAVQNCLGRLRAADFLYEKALLPGTEYVFKHALTHAVAYQMLLPRARQQLHERVAEQLLAILPETASRRPDWVAHHLTEAGRLTEAIAYWARAGQRAADRAAHAEALASLRRGLELLHRLPDGPARRRQEADLQIAIGRVTVASRGHSDPDVQRAYTRARTLAMQDEHVPQLAAALRGLWMFSMLREDVQESRALAESLLSVAEKDDDVSYAMVAHWVMGMTLLHQGEFLGARDYLQRAIALDAGPADGRYASTYAVDPGTSAVIHQTHAHFILGWPDQAVELSKVGLERTEELGDSFTKAGHLILSAVLRQFRREAAVVRSLTDAALTLSHEHRFPFWLAFATALRGWAAVEAGDPDTGVSEMQQALTALDAIGTNLYRPYFLALLAEAHWRAGTLREAHALLGQALARADASGEHFYDAELHRLRGEILASEGPGVRAEAEQCFRQALDIATRQAATSWELRAAVSLARLDQSQGRAGESHARLAAVYRRFSEGFETADLKEARTLLAAIDSRCRPGEGAVRVADPGSAAGHGMP